jgi:hypothetical protein
MKMLQIIVLVLVISVSHAYALESSQKESIKILHDIVYNAVKDKGNTPIDEAIKNDILEILKKDSIINAKYDNSYPLGVAIENENIDMVKFLINNGADVTLEEFGEPMFIDAMNTIYDKQTLELIISKAANAGKINEKGEKFGFTALMTACWKYNKMQSIY